MIIQCLQRLTILMLAFIILIATKGSADSIYKWTDTDGKVHYSSKPDNKSAVKADLPEITRGEVKMPDTLLDSCKNHGGIDCASGADKDGSVKCSDGFLDSAQRFSFSCSSAKLEVSNVSEVNRGGGFTVNIRNSKSVTALSPKVIYKFDDHTNYELKGPEKIESFEVAEFLFDPDSQLPEQNRLELVKKLKPTSAKIEISCSNCS